MIKALAIIGMMVLSAHNVEVATVVETYDNTMIVETRDGNEWVYEFEDMTEREMYAQTVLVVGDTVVVLA